MIAKSEDFTDTDVPKGKSAKRIKCNAVRIVIKTAHEDLIDLCSDLEPVEGDIITAAGDVMGIIKFKRTICFMGIRLERYVADTNTSIVSLGKTALENGFVWIMGPGDTGSVSHLRLRTLLLR